MNLPEYSLRHSRVVLFVLAVMLAGGVAAFLSLGKKEDAPFVIRTAVIVTSYRGATPDQVEELISEPIEREIQALRNVRKVTSRSSYGQSRIMLELEPTTAARDIPQLWDELRRMLTDIRPSLPAGASTVEVIDDFGDVSGIYYGLSADAGYDYDELRNWAELIKREIITLDGVQKVSLFGIQSPVINLYVSLSRLSNFAVKPTGLIAFLAAQNTLVGTGVMRAGEMEIIIMEDGTYRSLDDIANQIVTSSDGRQVRVGDIARVERGYREPPQALMRVNGRRAVGIGISTAVNRDVVRTGESIERRMESILSRMPVGMELTSLYPENRIAQRANGMFFRNLSCSLLLVICAIMLAMGVRAGMLIGSTLIFSIAGTLLLMLPLGEGLNRTSLAGFIIAMGMLVDNAIVVVNGAQMAMNRNMSVRRALAVGADTSMWGLLGATLIAVFSFLPLYLAPSSVIEIVKPLFVVITVALLLSWLLSISQTPLFGLCMLRRPNRQESTSGSERLHTFFGRLIGGIIRFRWLTVLVAVVLLVLSIWTLRRMPQNFFPYLDKPYLRADCLLPDGYSIRAVEQRMEQLERWLIGQEAVGNVSIAIGASPPRYYLAGSSFAPQSNYANLLVELVSTDSVAVVEERFDNYVEANMPDMVMHLSRFKLSPEVGSVIEFGFLGPDVDTLAALSARVERVMKSDVRCRNVRNSWGNRIPVWSAQYSPKRGQRMAITRTNMAEQLNVATNGYRLGNFRSGDQVMPILLKDERIDNYNLGNLTSLPIYTPAGRVTPLEQVSDGASFDFCVPAIERLDRRRVMKVGCDPRRGVNANALFEDLYRYVTDSVRLPAGYQMQIFGEHELQQESVKALVANVPLALGLIIFTLLLLFNSFRRVSLILLCVPFVITGAVAALLIAGRMFDLFSMLGLLTLVGMSIRNSIVLMDRISRQNRKIEYGFHALVAPVTHCVPTLSIASGTTVLGVVPLLSDSMFASMAVTIIGGLVASVLTTLLVLPALYTIFFPSHIANKRPTTDQS